MAAAAEVTAVATAAKQRARVLENQAAGHMRFVHGIDFCQIVVDYIFSDLEQGRLNALQGFKLIVPRNPHYGMIHRG